MSTEGQRTLQKRYKSYRGKGESWETDRAPGQEDKDLDLVELSDQEDSADELNLQLARSKTPEISYNEGENVTGTSKGIQTGGESTEGYQSEAVSDAGSGISQAGTDGEDDEATQGRGEDRGGKKKKGKKGKKWSALNLGGEFSSGQYLVPPSTTSPGTDGYTTVGSRHRMSDSKGSMTSVGSASSQH